MEKTLTDLKSMLKPGGRMAIFMNNHIGPDDPPENRAVEKSWLYGALKNLGLTFETEKCIAERARRALDSRPGSRSD